MISVILYLECTLKDNETLYKHCELHNDGDEPHRNKWVIFFQEEKAIPL